MSKLRVGDKVVCIDVGGSRILNVGVEYEVSELSVAGDDDMVNLSEVPRQSFYASRFSRCVRPTQSEVTLSKSNTLSVKYSVGSCAVEITATGDNEYLLAIAKLYKDS